MWIVLKITKYVLTAVRVFLAECCSGSVQILLPVDQRLEKNVLRLVTSASMLLDRYGQHIFRHHHYKK
jgi:hypothetical protein